MRQAMTKQGLVEAGGTGLLALMYLFFIVSHVQAFAETPRLSLLLFTVFETLCLAFVLIRKQPNDFWLSWKVWTVTMGGTFAPLLFRPADVPADLLAGQVIQVVGFVLQIGALLALNRSFGLLPAHRGVKSSGLYRWIRHPLYTAYALAQFGYVVNNFDGYNVLIWLVATGFQVLRILNEEKFLRRYEEYEAYARQTRWRLIPLLW